MATEWVLEQVALNSGKILPAAARFLVEYCGSNPWTLANEIEKLVLYSKTTEKPISEHDIQDICYPSDDIANFAFSNAMQSGKKEEIMAVLDKLFSAGEAPQAIFNRDLVPTIRQLLQIRFAIDFGVSPKDTGVHPFVFGKLKRVAKKFSSDSLLRMHSALLKMDIDSKSGSLTATAEKTQIYRLEAEKNLLALFGSFLKIQNNS